MLTKDFVSRVHVRFHFFNVAYFHLAGRSLLGAPCCRQHYSFSHDTTTTKFSLFSSNEIRLLCFESLTLTLSLLST